MTNNDSTIPEPRYVMGDVPATAVPLPAELCAEIKQHCYPRDPEAELRRACAEGLLAGSLLLADVSRALGQWDAAHPAKQSEERLRKALETMREALS